MQQTLDEVYGQLKQQIDNYTSQQFEDERNQLLEQVEQMRAENAQLTEIISNLRQDNRREQHAKDQELTKLLECVKHEVHKKYHSELMTVCNSVMELKQRVSDELLQKQKEVKQLHL